VTDIPHSERRNFYGRVHGKTLRPAQRLYLTEDLPRLRIPGVARAENPSRQTLDLAALGRPPYWLEIGFGGGEHLAHQAATHPGVTHLGCEIFVNGVAMLLGHLRERPCASLRIHDGDIRDLMEVLPDASIARAVLLYPDPWPKARHHRRRFVTQDYLRPLHRVLEAGAEFRVATDIPDYVRQTRAEVPKAGFELIAEGGTPWAGWPSTRYERKALRDGRVPHYLTYRRA
jgi:tRNA (guanine-N7-)-methyltransferase